MAYTKDSQAMKAGIKVNFNEGQGVAFFSSFLPSSLSRVESEII